jgi:hypothetical protein
MRWVFAERLRQLAFGGEWRVRAAPIKAFDAWFQRVFLRAAVACLNPGNNRGIFVISASVLRILQPHH